MNSRLYIGLAIGLAVAIIALVMYRKREGFTRLYSSGLPDPNNMDAILGAMFKPEFETPLYLTQYEHQDHMRNRYERAMVTGDLASVPWPITETSSTAKFTLERERSFGDGRYYAPAYEAATAASAICG